MRTKTAPPSVAPWLDDTSQPDERDLRKTLKQAYAPLAKVVTWLRCTQPGVTVEERFHAQTGWHQICLLKQRRLFYLTPKPGDFRFAMILGDRAIAGLRHGNHAGRLPLLLKAAKRYPEGTAFIFDRSSFDPPLIIALLEAKIAH